ncbi:ral guanine nucleotide dissociation stimulator-like 1 [Phyllopteryx taeniolatus]|uniref:ral guanine nucleotide dissociation stimulator-like 1 n=1 Tax=Phyllopteryx taeniolatus TaxID=161469 RepID=UPI002AD228CC|nr:ral guanine nucleotide dissociation stimulator-like 1 [Phyllopteryx taeniolatus]
MGKWELTMNPVQEWGEESVDGALYGITLHRVPVPSWLDPSSNPSCAFVQYRTNKVRRLKAASLQMLVSHLLDHACLEQDYSRIFLSTYRTFTSTTKLLDMIFQRDSEASELDNSECNLSPLLAFVQTWLDEYSEDLRDPPLHPGLQLLLDHLRISSAMHDQLHRQPNFSSLAGQTENLLRRFQKEESETHVSPAQADVPQHDQLSGDEDSGYEHLQDQSDILDFSSRAIAEQLTRIDSALFIKVAPYQCLGCIWSQRDKKENMSPTIRATIAQFNAITNLVIISLLCRPACVTSSPTPPQRARILEKWIRVAQDCRHLKNFSSLKAILSALQANAVYRLRKTWAAVSRDCMVTFDNLCETYPDENCLLTNKELLVENISSGVVPYLGTYLTVLTMLDTALPDTVEAGLVNFEKRRREYEVLSQIHVLQVSCTLFNLPHYPRIAAWMQGHKLLTDQESYELSRQLEPPVDVCSPTTWSHRTLTKKLSSLLTISDGSKKLPADQISVSSSGSSGSELEDLSSPNSACSIRLQSFHSSCNNVSEVFSSSSSSSSSSSPCSSAALSPDSQTPSGSSTDSLCSSATSCAAAPPLGASNHKRGVHVSMISLPVYNRQGADSCIVRVNVDLGHNNGNMYKSVLLTSQDKTAHVIQRALEKHNLEHMNWQEFTLTQVISHERELLIPDKANVFYAMSTTANFDFVLRRFHKGQKKPLRATSSLGRYTK